MDPVIAQPSATDSIEITVLIYNHHDDWEVSGVYEIDLRIEGLPFEGDTLLLTHYRIDQSHSNAYAEWMRQGKPMYPAPEQRAAIKAREGLELLEPPQKIVCDGGKLRLSFELPVHGISLVSVSSAR